VPTGFHGDPPIVLALLSCDSASMNVGPFSKWSVLGLYDRVLAPALPVLHYVTVFAVLMDVREPVTLTFRITRPSDAPGSLGTLLGVAEIQTAPLPGDTAQAWIATQLSLAEEGRYEIQLFGNEAYMAHKPFIVSTTNAAAPKED